MDSSSTYISLFAPSFSLLNFTFEVSISASSGHGKKKFNEQVVKIEGNWIPLILYFGLAGEKHKTICIQSFTFCTA